MAIIRIPNNDQATWLANRREDVTGSQVGALFDLHRYLTPAKLYAEKIGALPADDGKNAGPKTRGQRLEKLVAEMVQEKHPEWEVYKATDYYRDTEIHLGGTPDYFISRHRTGEPNMPLEIKTCGASDFRSIWKGGDPEAEPIPEAWQILQNLTYQYLTGFHGGMIAVMPVGEWEPLDVHEIDVPWNPQVVEKIKDKVLQFWTDIARGERPEFNYSRDADVIKALYASADSSLPPVDLTRDPEISALVTRLETLRRSAKVTKEAEEETAARIRVKIGDAEAAIVPGFEYVTAKSTYNKGYTVAPFSFRSIRMKRSKAA